MTFEVVLSNSFKKEAKRLIKKYPSLRDELRELGDELALNPTLGTHLGNDVYKIRLAIASKRKGKSGGARIITFVKVVDAHIYLLTIYNKSEQSDISDAEIRDILKDYL